MIRIPNTLCLSTLLLTHVTGFTPRPQAKHATHISMSLSPELLEMNKSTRHDEENWFHDGVSAWADWLPLSEKEEKKVDPLLVPKGDWVAASFGDTEVEPVVGLLALEERLKTLPQQNKFEHEWYSDGFGWSQYFEAISVDIENHRAAGVPPSVYHSHCFESAHGVLRCSCQEMVLEEATR